MRDANGRLAGSRRTGRSLWRAMGLAILLPLTALGQYEFTISFNFSVTITKYTGAGGAVVIPDTLAGFAVRSIGPQAFMGLTNLTSVTVPATVTNVGDRAFATNANLLGVYFRSNAPVAGANVFAGTPATVFYLTNTTGWTATYAGRPTAVYSPPILSVFPLTREVEPEAGTTTFTIANTGGGILSYEVTESETWLDIVASGGTTLTVGYTNNPGLWTRTGTVTVTSSGVEGSPQVLTIVQTAPPVLTARPWRTNLSCLASAGHSLQVAGNQAWTAVSSADWLIITAGAAGTNAGTVSYRVRANAGAARSATITVAGGGLTRRHTVDQAAFSETIEITPAAQAHPAAGTAAQSVTVRANVAWTAAPSANWIRIVAGGSGTGNGVVTYAVEENPGEARSGTLTVSGEGATAVLAVSQAARPRARAYDFDGDGKADLSVFHRPARTWYVAGSAGGALSREWDRRGLLAVPADYDGDGRTDLATYELETGEWLLLPSGSAQTQQVVFGSTSSLPLPGDYDGDGKADPALYDPADGRWRIRGSRAGTYSAQWGGPGLVPVPADYDGDGALDLAVYEPYAGEWQILFSSTGRRLRRAWGWAQAVPVPGDYDGDGRADIAVFHRADCAWYISLSGGGSRLVRYPLRGAIPVPADYDGDGMTDLAVYHPRSGYWYVLQSSTGIIVRQWWGAPTANATLQIPLIHAWFNLP